jgi:hypothetical protein
LLYPNPVEFDSHLDLDDDGLDVDRNGERSKDEVFTNLEEWWYHTEPNNDNSDNDVSEDGYYVNDGSEVYFFQLRHPEVYREPTVGLPGNGVSEVLAAQTTQRDGRLKGCYPNYESLESAWGLEPAAPGGGDEGGPPLLAVPLSALVAALAAVAVVRWRPVAGRPVAA